MQTENKAIRKITKYGEVVGYKKCPKWLHEAYERAVNHVCQECGRVNEKLTPHRKIRGNKGGLYTVCNVYSKLSNVKIICEKCHKKIHSREPGCTRK